jgi:hypothetical protein
LNPAAPSKPEHCPDCGAELKPGAQWCWLCNYKSPAAAKDGPDGAGATRTRSNWLALTGFVVMAVAFVPACAVAFFIGCSAFLFSGPSGPGSSFLSHSFESSLLVGLVGAVIVAVLMVVLMVALFRSYHRSTLPPEMRNAR